MTGELEKRIENKSAKIAVVGLGYVGLPLARCAREAGYDVVGIDRYMNDDRRREIEEEGPKFVEMYHKADQVALLTARAYGFPCPTSR